MLCLLESAGQLQGLKDQSKQAKWQLSLKIWTEDPGPPHHSIVSQVCYEPLPWRVLA